MSVSKRRFSVTLTEPYADRLDRLVEKGINMDHQNAIRAALRLYFEYHGMPLIYSEVAGW